MSDLTSNRPRVFLGSWVCALTGCFISHVQTISADPSSISVQYEGAPYAHVLAVGKEHCADFGKIAWPSGNEPVDDGHGHEHGHIQHFQCVDRAPGVPG